MSRTIAAILVALVAINATTGVPVQQKTPAQLARYVMSKTNWVGISTISTIEQVKDYPIVNVKSTADGDSGVPYLFFSDLDFSVIDINVNPRASLLATLADGECVERSLDPQDPRCPRLILTGKVVKVEDEEEKAFAREALIAKHPAIAEWETAHMFYITKLDIERIAYLGNFGGADIIDPADYLAAQV